MDSEEDPELYEMLYGDSWPVDGIHRNAPGDFGFQYLVPTPLNAEAWIVHQPRSEQWRRMTRVN